MLEMPHSALEALTDDLLIHKIPMSILLCAKQVIP